MQRAEQHRPERRARIADELRHAGKLRGLFVIGRTQHEEREARGHRKASAQPCERSHGRRVNADQRRRMFRRLSLFTSTGSNTLPMAIPALMTSVPIQIA